MQAVPLTRQQIDEILTAVPNPRGAGKSALAIARKHLVDRTRVMLERIRLAPVPEAFEEFKSHTIQGIAEAQVEPGMSVGVLSGVSLGGPSTQLSLNSFHFSGNQSGVALAFQKIRDFLTGSKMNRNPQMRILFKSVSREYPATDLHDTRHVGTFNSVLELRPQLEQMTVADLLLEDGVQILDRDEAVAARVPEMIQLHALMQPNRFQGSQLKFPLSHVVELKLNTYRMFSHNITMAMLARAIEGPDATLTGDTADAITVVWRSQVDGRAYILLDETRNYGLNAMDQNVAILMFLHRTIIPKFGQYQVSGITGIFTLEPLPIDVLKGVYRTTRDPDNPNQWFVYTTHFRTRWDGVSLADIHYLYRLAGFVVQPITEQNKEDLMIVVESVTNPTDQLERRVVEARGVKPDLRTPEQQKLVDSSTFYYASTTGSNMEDVLWRDDVDLYRTVSNHAHDINKLVGTDAATIFLIFRFRQILQDFGANINARHISLIFYLLTNLGIINSLSFTGINRRRVGPLAAASFERSMDVFMSSAIFGDRESIVGVSPSIYLGQKSKRVGTGATILEEDLTLMPQETPAMPTVDELTTLDERFIDEEVIEGSNLESLLEQEETTEERRRAVGGVIRRQVQPTVISPYPQPVRETLAPPSEQTVTPPAALMSALRKVTTGTPLSVEPSHETPQVTRPAEVVASIAPPVEDFPDITTISLEGLELLPRSGRFSPAVVPQITSSLPTVGSSATVAPPLGTSAPPLGTSAPPLGTSAPPLGTSAPPRPETITTSLPVLTRTPEAPRPFIEQLLERLPSATVTAPVPAAPRTVAPISVQQFLQTVRR